MIQYNPSLPAFVMTFRPANLLLYLLICLAACGLSHEARADFTPGELIVKLARIPERGTLDNIAATGIASVDSLISTRHAEAIAAVPRFDGAFPEMESVVLLRFNSDEDAESVTALLHRDNGVVWVTRNYHYHPNSTDTRALDEGMIPNDDLFAQQWWLDRISAPLAWTHSQGDSSVIIGIVDTGVDYLHPDLRPNIWFNWAERNGLPDFDDDGNGFVDDSIGWDFVDAPNIPVPGDYLHRDSNPMDEMGHGTQVAGIAAAATNNGACMASIGFACRIMCLRAGDALGLLEEDDVAAAILYAAQMGAKVINMSFGDTVESPLIRDAVRLAAARGVILVGSAGNAGSQMIHYPSGYPEVISVGASTQFDQRAGFSNYGPSVDVLAPGVNLFSMAIDSVCSSGQIIQGTSFAAPQAAGTVGLMLHINPDLSPQDAKQIIRGTADDIDEEGWDPETANGRLNAYQAVRHAAVGSAIIARITSPVADTGLSSDFEVFGEASGGAFSRWNLDYGIGENPQAWEPIASDTLRAYASRLGIVPIPAQDTVLVLRLEVHGFDSSSTVDNVHLYIQHDAPRIDSLRAHIMLDQDTYGELFEIWTNQYSRASFILTNTEGDSAREYFGYVAKEHAGFISARRYSGRWTVRVRIENVAGLSVESDSFTFEVTSPSFSSNLWSLSPTNLRYGRLGSFASDFNNNGQPEVWLTPRSEDTLFALGPYEWNGTEFDSLGSVYGVHYPLCTGDADQDGQLELLAYKVDVTRIWEQSRSGAFPNRLVFEDTTGLSGNSLVDLDPTDGHGELIGWRNTYLPSLRRFEHRYVIFGVDANYSVAPMDTIPNETVGITYPDGTRNSPNNLGQPGLLTGDFDADGLPDFLYGDYDGDIIFCEFEDGHSIQKWTTRLPLPDATTWIAGGDVDGDGRVEFIAGCRSNNSAHSESQQHSLHWEYYLFRNVSDNTFASMDTINILGNEYVGSNPASVTAADINSDGRSDILISAFPDYYVFVWNPAVNRLEPQWYHQPANAGTSLAYDWNGDGETDVLWSDGERFVVMSAQPAAGNRPGPPFGLQGEPLDESSIRLKWRTVADADSYVVYRAAVIPDFVRIHAATDTNLILTGIETDRVFHYAVSAYSTVFPVHESVLSNYVQVAANDPPILADSALFIPRQYVQLAFSEAMGSSAFEQLAYRLDGSRMPTNATSAEGGRVVILSFDGDFAAGNHAISVGDVHDAQGTLLPPANRITYFDVEYHQEEYPHVLASNLIGDVEVSEIDIVFSEPMSSSVLDPQNFLLNGPRRVLRIDSLSATRDRIRLQLDSRYPVGASGLVDTLYLRQIMSADGRLLDGTGATILLLGKTMTDLAGAYAYPNPYHGVGPGGGEEGIMFAGLPETATIRIFSLRGLQIRKIEHANFLGGTRWDLLNENGEKVASGVYVYTIETRSEKTRGKIAVLR